MIAPCAGVYRVQPSGLFVRLVALLLLLVGLQSGVFRDLGSARQWVFGADTPVAAVMSESRKLDGLPADGDPAVEPRVHSTTKAGFFARPALPALRAAPLLASHLRYSTGPPRA